MRRVSPGLSVRLSLRACHYSHRPDIRSGGSSAFYYKVEITENPFIFDYGFDYGILKTKGHFQPQTAPSTKKQKPPEKP
jgi:hypothetical protein